MNKTFEKINAIKELIRNNKNENKRASLIFMSPDAIGLYFFNGCNLSSLISIESLSKYTELDIKQKQIRERNELANTSFSKLRPKIGAANTKRFLVHWFGLQEIIKGFIFSEKKGNIFLLINSW